jgi:hypothetical protein
VLFRSLTVRADVAAGVLPDQVVGALASKVAEFAAKLPQRYRLEIGGMYEESGQSSASVFAVLPLMIVLMLATMMVMLVSFRRLAMVVALLPLGLIGVVLALLVSNRPLGFVAILGILALIGMIAKNAPARASPSRSHGSGGRGGGVSVFVFAAPLRRPPRGGTTGRGALSGFTGLGATVTPLRSPPRRAAHLPCRTPPRTAPAAGSASAASPPAARP